MFKLTKPCKECPFHTDCLKGWLGRERAQEIADSLVQQDLSFTCHKTLDKPRREHQHCAGAMILLERLNRPNQMMRIGERIGFYDRRKLKMNAPVFESVNQFVAHHDWEDS